MKIRVNVSRFQASPSSPPDGGLAPLSRFSPREYLARFDHQVVKELRDTPPVRPADARLVLANVMVRDSGASRAPAPAEFFESFAGEFIKDGKVRVGEMLTSRQRLVSFEGALDSSPGATCIRYRRVTEITGQFPAFPELVAISSTRGLYCSHPQWPQYEVNMTFQQVYAKGQEPLAYDADADDFLKTLVFTNIRPGGEPTARSYLRDGEAAYQQQRWAAAESAFQSALRELESATGDSIAVGVAAYYLASTWQKLGRDAEAEPVFKRALAIWEAAPHGVAAIFAATLQDLAIVYARRADFDQATPLLLRALVLQEKEFGPDDPQVARTLANLAAVYRDADRLSDAERAGLRAVSLFERAKGPDHPDVAAVLQTLTEAYLRQNKLKEAESSMRRRISIVEKTDDPRLAAEYSAYAELLRALNRVEEAKAYEALAERQRQR